MADDSKAETSDMIGPGPSSPSKAIRPRGTARGAAVRLLARRDHASGDLRQKLLRRGFPPEEVEAALASLARVGYLDDARWASEFARHYLSDGRGWQWIRLRISRAGAAPPPAPSPSREARYLLALLERRGVDLSALTDLREKAKIIRFLRGRGYRMAAISIALGPDASDLDGEED